MKDNHQCPVKTVSFSDTTADQKNMLSWALFTSYASKNRPCDAPLHCMTTYWFVNSTNRT